MPFALCGQTGTLVVLSLLASSLAAIFGHKATHRPRYTFDNVGEGALA